MLVAAALAGATVFAVPAGAGAQIDGAPLNVIADGLGGIQIRQDGIAAGLFYDPDENPGHAGLEIKEGPNHYPLESGFDAAPGRTRLSGPTLADGGATKLLASVYTVGPNLRVTETISYTDNVPQVNIAYDIENVSTAPTSLRAGALADLYVGNNDSGNGAIAATPPRFVGGREETSGLVYGLQEVTPWRAYQEGDFEAVFANFAADGLNNTVDSAAPDNGVGVEFALDNLAPGERRTIDVRWLLASPAPPGTVTPPAPSGNGNPGAAAPEIEQLPPPVTGKTVNVSVRRGRIFIKIPPSKTFVELKGAMQIPVGATIDATRGRVNLVSTTGTGDQTQLAWFYDGVFKVGQTRGAKPITDLALAEALAKCPKRSGGRASAAQKKKKTRKLWGEGKGAFRTSGKYSSATVRGTKWLVTDRCDGTLTRVTQGSVLVRDFKRKRNVVVRAGKQYLARR
ncbi:hypothetical protein DVA67_023555 [Solirubrobacter sp. CPCC 204708]|uniref:Uncharacterized protein n=1 Tax=Solirubrobacter deserti TaxID=2282478 RepID=A0ABT4RL82_9ACTN|nr:hypothetical protein [Solirubrobacter deserti]MBE2318970.1 hypothetical protein [Solirubrobacter deserti]MDA0139305.1 hypothetical protein [Solirubrobacter deserti]